MSEAHFGPRGSAVPSTPTPPPSGDAGKSLLPDALSAPLDAAGAKQVSEAGARLKELASSGGFAVNEEGFQAYLKACNFFLSGFTAMRRDVDLLSQGALMGSSDYAKSIAAYNVTVASGDHEALIPILDKMLDGITQARDAITIARDNYRESDEESKVPFSKLNKETDSR
ncbi:hypothetical protein QRX50_12530 [Amycolatopsis carbonis]|uniref:Uncharacterized protein n=1 Tax=Amycolatopsis carbonis TaxID=715471 RepID=A0A9Y2MU85_9PSEU|nr:hypothetical protein [Amycolatopsis sp. 2-15]WIX81520.1 hypothetical protein QRX50_12530 [Amycolatopsis sp. 2-15]